MSTPQEGEKRDIKDLLAVIPPASARKQEKRTVQEKRVKLRKMASIEPGYVAISAALVKELSIKDRAEISVKGRRVKLQVIVQEGIPPGEIWASSNDPSLNLFSDNSVVTVRSLREV